MIKNKYTKEEEIISKIKFCSKLEELTFYNSNSGHIQIEITLEGIKKSEDEQKEQLYFCKKNFENFKDTDNKINKAKNDNNCKLTRFQLKLNNSCEFLFSMYSDTKKNKINNLYNKNKLKVLKIPPISENCENCEYEVYRICKEFAKLVGMFNENDSST